SSLAFPQSPDSLLPSFGSVIFSTHCRCSDSDMGNEEVSQEIGTFKGKKYDLSLNSSL
ncbi:hypothetical protein LINPERPRIM_LOCUS10135, partial [Linum perenne]